ncbi:hypothetical protein, partial [Pontimonas sp.]|uniref:hypothetical protein n=1 Tax=Pontimonas sp. TaxID=2304492 RepID=UPI00287028BD
MSDALRSLAHRHMHRPTVELVEGVGREGVLNALGGKKNTGIELGVAAGSFSAKMTGSGKFDKVFGVDTYDDY